MTKTIKARSECDLDANRKVVEIGLRLNLEADTIFHVLKVVQTLLLLLLFPVEPEVCFAHGILLKFKVMLKFLSLEC